MKNMVALLIVALSLVGCVPQTPLAGRGCNAAIVSATEIVTAAHCLSPYNGGVTSIRSGNRRIQAIPFVVDMNRDVAHLSLSEPIFAPYYAVYREPEVGATGYVFGGCPLCEGAHFRVMATERAANYSDGIARWTWAVRDGVVSCPGDSGSPIWSDTEPGVYYGSVSRYERLRMKIGNTLVLFDSGTTIMSGVGE